MSAATPVERRRVAAALGFAYTVPDPAPSPTDDRRTAPSERPIEPRYVSPFHPDSSPVRPIERATAESGGDDEGRISMLLDVQPLDQPGEQRPPQWAVVTDVVPADEPRHLRHQPALEPLFTPNWTRTTLSAFAATQVAEGAIDFRKVLEALYRRRPLAVLPRELVWTLRRGIQVLVDENEGFSFYERDASAIVEMLAAVASRDRTEVLRFFDVPTRGVRRARFDPPTVWRPPAAGTPIVIVSDFGLVRGAKKRGGATVDHWERVAAMSRAAGCALLGIVPLEPRRWPPRLKRAVKLLRWDRRATAALARRVARGELA